MAMAENCTKPGEAFWKAKTLEEMNPQEWEALCDGCGRCCLNKLEDWDTGEIAWTKIACTLFDDGTCRCKNYLKRHETVPDCVPLTPASVRQLHWLPVTCAYRLIAEGRDLYWWHPLVSGSAETVHEAGISVRGRTIPEDDIAVENYEDYVIEPPTEDSFK
ncbi:YcgN family cysteine cluster protein [Hongsoonwoonella zoysiae]|uniref:YcgN family cysteine cluster protein n=1 Tax=Hongsoonwoonella zoysiae TaxID=2821844 RepID=UPI001FE5E511|nr:YcgN family cysteine cluster protein [Hongsoonwoonella zoysiae]